MITTTRSLNVFVAALCLTIAAVAQADPPRVGEKAPLFEGTDQGGKSWKAADFFGKRLRT